MTTSPLARTRRRATASLVGRAGVRALVCALSATLAIALVGCGLGPKQDDPAAGLDSSTGFDIGLPPQDTSTYDLGLADTTTKADTPTFDAPADTTTGPFDGCDDGGDADAACNDADAADGDALDADAADTDAREADAGDAAADTDAPDDAATADGDDAETIDGATGG